jgi:hypothetical protein
MLVLVRRGSFTRYANGIPSVLDPTVACFVNPGEEKRYDHPHNNGDHCTAVGLDATLASALHGGDTTSRSVRCRAHRHSTLHIAPCSPRRAAVTTNINSTNMPCD